MNESINKWRWLFGRLVAVLSVRRRRAMRRWGAVDKEKMAATGRRLCANWVVCYLGRATATGATSRHSSDFRH